MRFAGTPDITPPKMLSAGAPECLHGIVKAPDKVMAETHKKKRTSPTREGCGCGRKCFCHNKKGAAGNTCMVLPRRLTKLWRKQAAHSRIRSAEAKCKKKGEIPTMPCGAIL